MTAPCPICGREPKMHKIKTGFALSCVGDRHYVGIDDEGKHAVEIYRVTTESEARTAWDKFFGGKAA
jgi:aminopeptidase-like protein